MISALGQHVGKELQGLLGLLLSDVLAVEDVDELGVLLGLGLRQTAQQLLQLPVGAEELVLRQGQIVAPLDGKAVEVGVPGGVGDLGGVYAGRWPRSWRRVLSSSSASGSITIRAEMPWGTVLVGSTTTCLPSARRTHCSAAMMMFLLLGRTKTISAGVRVDLPQDVVGGGVHGLAAADDAVGPQDRGTPRPGRRPPPRPPRRTSSPARRPSCP